MGGTYHQEGDYFLPDLLPPESIPVGIWGERRGHYLKTHRELTAPGLLMPLLFVSHHWRASLRSGSQLQLIKALACGWTAERECGGGAPAFALFPKSSALYCGVLFPVRRRARASAASWARERNTEICPGSM
ncbi:TnpV protein [Pseudoflavonifractor sp. 524-17]|uniref:TnpV protein n=1 Tax=Pseudoflavonifractor sp. 524-17 TaxID=2304577 RepID=UPI00192A538A